MFRNVKHSNSLLLRMILINKDFFKIGSLFVFNAALVNFVRFLLSSLSAIVQGSVALVSSEALWMEYTLELEKEFPLFFRGNAFFFDLRLEDFE